LRGGAKHLRHFDLTSAALTSTASVVDGFEVFSRAFVIVDQEQGLLLTASATAWCSP
jgi:hypothetical protein